ncbi:MAG: anaerobic sulfatase maturase, partial [Tannerellaceae bacterium]|nr:anaerobic sulfatase maturase [Tannerellaceae bacterium]
MNKSAFAPFARPLYVMLKPAGAICNLRCTYCYYLEKRNLYLKEKNVAMSDALLERFIEQYLGAQTMPEVLFTWHGGEP